MTDLETAIGYSPKIAIEEGVERFVAWFRDYQGSTATNRL
jgi:nucleoside-diphosphate-sugar epimerase